MASVAPPCSGGRGRMKSEKAKRFKAFEEEGHRLMFVDDQAREIQLLIHLSDGNR
jgi:hypothetical protein